jgi:hypothetical protein
MIAACEVTDCELHYWGSFLSWHTDFSLHHCVHTAGEIHIFSYPVVTVGRERVVSGV